MVLPHWISRLFGGGLSQAPRVSEPPARPAEPPRAWAPPQDPAPATIVETPPAPAVAPLSTPLAAPERKPRRHDPVSTFVLHYVDRKGEITRRVVTLGAIKSRETGEIWIAFCRLRRSVRTFRAEAALRLEDAATGERLGRDAIACCEPAYFSDLILDAGGDEPDGAPFRSIAEARAHFAPALSPLGWTLRTQREPFADRLGLHRMTRRGDRPMKYPTLSLSFEPVFCDYAHGQPHPTPGNKRDKPWRVSGPTRTWLFERASEAAAAFEALARDPEMVER